MPPTCVAPSKPRRWSCVLLTAGYTLARRCHEPCPKPTPKKQNPCAQGAVSGPHQGGPGARVPGARLWRREIMIADVLSSSLALLDARNRRVSCWDPQAPHLRALSDGQLASSCCRLPCCCFCLSTLVPPLSRCLGTRRRASRGGWHRFHSYHPWDNILEEAVGSLRHRVRGLLHRRGVCGVLENRRVDNVQTRHSRRRLARRRDLGSDLLRFRERRPLHGQCTASSINR